MSSSSGTAEAEALAARWDAVMMRNYGTPKVALVRGRGARVWDADGRELLDLVGGIAVNALGHGHPAVAQAVADQVGTLGHTSNLAIHEPGVRLAERLVGLLDPSSARGGRVFFCNSGAEANEAALKISRLTGRTGLVAAEGSFHGRTMGALALTGQPAKRAPFEPLPGEVTFVPYGDEGALAAAVGGSTAAVVLEPLQGEGGVVVPPAGYLRGAQAVAHREGALFVLDEVQTGVGRTGDWFVTTAEALEPDVVTLAKGLGGGLPMGAVVAFGLAATAFGPGHHGSTFGGNPVAAAAALAVLDTIEAEGLLARATAVGAALGAGVERLGHPLVSHVRGRGLLLGIVLAAPVAAAVERAALSHGILVNAAAPDVVRLAPPLVLSDGDVDLFLSALPALLDDAESEGSTS